MSVQNKFNVGDKVKWNDAGYWREFFEDEIGFEDVLTVIGYEDHPSLVELQNDSGFVVIAFDWRFDLVESFQELNGTPSIQWMPSVQGKTCSQNCVSCKDKETPVLEENDENGWFKRGELPPVGTACECHNSVGKWVAGKVVYIGVDQGETLAIVQTDAEILYGTAGCEFRPIKTVEQIAEEGRKAGILEMIDVFGTDTSIWGLDSVRDICAWLYDAGYRKPEEIE